MCHHVIVTLSAEEKKEARKFSGVLIPVYASIVLAVIAVAALSAGSPQGEQVAATTGSATTR